MTKALFVSKIGIARFQNNKRFFYQDKRAWKAVIKELLMLLSGNRKPNSHKIGEFFVSPNGESYKGIRLAWVEEGEVIKVMDFLYHENQDRYLDNWDQRVFEGSIKRLDYDKSGYVMLPVTDEETLVNILLYGEEEVKKIA